MNQKTNIKQPLIILASGSSSRKKQLQNLGFDFIVKPSGIDEDFYKKLNSPKEEICSKIAQAKVKKVATKHPHDLILGGDQMAVLDSKIFNKTSSAKEAIKALMKLQGRSHKLLTAISMQYKEKSFDHLIVNKMTMRPLTKQQITNYVKLAKPLNCAGSYALERYGIALFEKIETEDQSAVIGFPLITLINQLVKWNIPLPSTLA